MRPLELKIRNFRSYSGEHTFDFRDRTLIGIVGPIGSGKSSILDAIVFSLYGRTPRIPNATKTLINQRAADASVVLRFEVEGEVWEVARSIRIKGPSKHALYHYADPLAEASETLTLEGEVNERIVDLLGLDFSAFERSVLLAQGRFAEFLQARPADRDRVLKGVFGHDRVDRMKGLAKDERDSASLAFEKLSVRLERINEIEARLGESKNELKSARKLKVRLDECAAAIAVLDERGKEAKAGMDTVAKRLEVLDQHADRLPDQLISARVIAEASTAEKRRADLAAAMEKAQLDVQHSEQAWQEANQSGELELLERASGLLAAAEPQLKAVVEADRRIAAAEALLAKAQDAESAKRERLDAARHVLDGSLGRAAEAAKILEDATEAFDRGRHADMAATLRSGLTITEPCPVCDQVVHDLPPAVGGSHLDELERVLAAAQRTKAEVDKTHTAALTAVEGAREQLQAAADRVAAAEAQLRGSREDAVRVRGDLEETTIRLDKILGPGDPKEVLEKRRSAFDALVAQRDAAQRRADQVRSEHDQAIRDEQESAKVLQDLGMQLADLAARLGVDHDIGDDAESLGRSLEHLRDSWSRVTSELREQLAAAEAETERVAADRAKLLAEVEVTGEIAGAIAVAADRIDRLEKLIETDMAELEQSEDLIAERIRLEHRVKLFSRINSDLTDSRFVRFLLDDERARLADLGSEHFQRLSAGRYRFADDQFAIVDLTAADGVRRADSLSGGETFLASLGLALALAEMVAGTGGRLDAFFLDEGFGTLDPEHLDLAMEGIEMLIADQSNRLVVIVSHVPELRDRIEDLIVLERNPATGDTRAIAGSGENPSPDGV